MALRVVYAIYIGRSGAGETVETFDQEELYDIRKRYLRDHMIEHVAGRAAVCDSCGYVSPVIDTWNPHRCKLADVKRHNRL